MTRNFTWLAMLAGIVCNLAVCSLSYAAPAVHPAGDGFMLEYYVVEQDFDLVMERVEIAHRMGATHFIIPVMMCQETKTSIKVDWCKTKGENIPVSDAYGAYNENERLERIVRIARELHVRGFSTAVLPFLLSYDGTWRGEFEPSDFKAWGASYRAMLDQLANAVSHEHISEFILGTELSHIYVPRSPFSRKEHARFWTGLLNEFRAKLAQTITPAPAVFTIANWDQYDSIPFWEASDFIALSSYFPLTSDDAATSVDELVRGWEPWASKLLAVSRKVKRPLYFAEVGYSSRSDAARQPWYYGTPVELDLDIQVRLFTAFGKVWGSADSRFREYGQALARFTIWALSRSEAPLEDAGYTVFDKPSEAAVSAIFADRRKLRGEAEPKRIQAVFTLDDLPMWAVSDSNERVSHYKRLRALLASRKIPAVAFVNPAFIQSDEEWTELTWWQKDGIMLANHTAKHQPRSNLNEHGFLADVDEASTILAARVPGWDLAQKFFRYPNLDWGPSNARESTCREIRNRGFDILPVSFDSRDWKLALDYHAAAAGTLSTRPSGGDKGRDVASRMINEVFSQLDRVRSREPLPGGSPEIFLIHSTRFSRDYLPNILTRLERAGVQWVRPDKAVMSAYAPGPRCQPRCIAGGRCN